MSRPKIEDVRFSSSSVDDFFHEKKFRRVAAAIPVGRVRVASAHELSGFHLVAHDKLVHLSQQDFWQLGRDNEGFFIERLVDDDTGPVKG